MAENTKPSNKRSLEDPIDLNPSAKPRSEGKKEYTASTATHGRANAHSNTEDQVTAEANAQAQAPGFAKRAEAQVECQA